MLNFIRPADKYSFSSLLSFHFLSDQKAFIYKSIYITQCLYIHYIMTKIIIIAITTLSILAITNSQICQTIPSTNSQCPKIISSYYKCNISHDYSTCFCDTQIFYYNDKKKECQINCFYLEGAQKTIENNSCSCFEGYKFTTFPILGCIKDCALYPGSYEINGHCQCPSGYQIISTKGCQLTPSTKSSIGLGLGFGLLFLILLIIWFCYRRYRRNHPPVTSIRKLQPNNSSSHLKIQQDRHTYGIHKFDKNENCSICLFSQVNTVLKCGHSFHFSCITEWLVRSKQCPTCRGEQPNSLKLFCMNCGQSYVKLDTSLLKDFTQINEILSKKQCTSCSSSFSIK